MELFEQCETFTLGNLTLIARRPVVLKIVPAGGSDFDQLHTWSDTQQLLYQAMGVR